MSKPSIFVIYGNMDRDFISMNKLVCFLHQEGFHLTVQFGFSDIACSADLKSIFDFCTKDRFDEYIRAHDLILSHAGVGAISSALKANKLPLVLPRKYSLAEHVNDHQIDFVSHFRDEGIFIEISDEQDLLDAVKLKKFLKEPSRKCITNLEPIKRDLHSYLAEL